MRPSLASTARRLRWLAILAVAAMTSGCTLQLVLSAQVITQDRAVGVPCLIRVWKDDIGPLDGKGTALASATVPSAEIAQLEVRVEVERTGPTLLWASFECDGYSIRVRAFESSPFDALLLPVVDLGRVWVPKKGMPYRPRRGPRNQKP